MVTIPRRQYDAVFKAIADRTRREILGLLRRGEVGGGGKTVGQIAARFRTSRPAISKHLRVLRRVGLVTSRKRGTATICELNPRPLRAVDEWLKDYAAMWDENLASLKKFVEENQ
jgi:DNA-binding transcriptional ArsR family regulator